VLVRIVTRWRICAGNHQNTAEISQSVSHCSRRHMAHTYIIYCSGSKSFVWFSLNRNYRSYLHGKKLILHLNVHASAFSKLLYNMYICIYLKKKILINVCLL